MPYKDIRKTRELIRKWKIRNKEKIRLQAQERHRRNYIPHPWIKLSDEELKHRKALQDKRYRTENAVFVKQMKTRYYQKNKKKIIEKYLKYLRENLNARIAHNLRGRMHSALKRQSKAGSAVRDLGCDIKQFKSYIESKFQPGMTWGNYGPNGWHLDHIKPLCRFDLTNQKQFLIAAHFSNYQPLWVKDNLSKSYH
jgi:hypothetical protein